jgi:hypothetical protein
MSRKGMLDNKLSTINDSLMILRVFGIVFGLLLKYKDTFSAFLFREVNIAIDESCDKRWHTHDRRGKVCKE